MSPLDPISCWPLDEAFPVVLHDSDLMKVLGLKRARFCQRKKAGEFRFLELRPQPAGWTLYSGRLVEKWVRGELGESRYFTGRKRA